MRDVNDLKVAKYTCELEQVFLRHCFVDFLWPRGPGVAPSSTVLVLQTQTIASTFDARGGDKIGGNKEAKQEEPSS